MTESRAPEAILPHRPPFLFVDEIVASDATSIHTRRRFRAEEDFFRGHFPGEPVVPGVLLVEAMAQSLACLALEAMPEALVFLTGVDKARFRRPVFPGQTVDFHIRVEGVRLGLVRAKAEARIEGQKVADAVLIGRVTPRAELEAARGASA